MADFDVNKLSTGDRVIAVSGIVLFIAGFLNWFGYGDEEIAEAAEAAGQSSSENGFGFTLPLIAILIGVAMVVVVALKLFDVKLGQPGSFTWGQVMLVAGSVAFAFVLIKTIAGVDVDTGGIDIDVDIDRKVGLFIGLVASAGLAAGGYLKFREDQGSGSPAPPTT